MDIREFWDLIEQTKIGSAGDHHLQEILLVDHLAGMPIEQIVNYQNIFDMLRSYADRRALWVAAEIIEGGCGDSSFEDFRAGLISQGETIYQNALRDPETLADVIKQGGTLRYEYMGYIAMYAYRWKTGIEDLDEFFDLSQKVWEENEPFLPADSDEHAEDHLWGAEEVVLRLRFPKLYEKFEGHYYGDSLAKLPSD